MKIAYFTESSLLSAVRAEFSVQQSDLIAGIGDDAAVIRSGKKKHVMTKDLLIEGTHFKLSWHPPFLLGRKSLNINLSDIASMGGVPRFVLLGLGLPQKMMTQWIEDFFLGFKSAAGDAGVALIGGDVCRAEKVMISVTVMGDVDRPVYRNGAAPGDAIFVSGTLGDAGQGLFLLDKGVKLGKDRSSDGMLKAFLDPVPLLSLGRDLSRKRIASAMIDVSDGLAVDLKHICEESRCGAEIKLADIPVSPALCRMNRRKYAAALHGGEDYQLLFTVPQKKIKLLSHLKDAVHVTEIGRITKDTDIHVIDHKGKRNPLMTKGFKHFGKS